MSDQLDQPYFEWLYSLINPLNQKNPHRTYWKLFRCLYSTMFTWSVPNDDNRVEDGRDLRIKFLDERQIPLEDVDPDWLEMECSFLEMLIGLSERASFITSEDKSHWFWTLLKNIGLRQFNDSRHIPKSVQATLDCVVQRKYSWNGSGGLFPLKHADRDQTGVELWYQLHAYIAEHE